MSVSRSADDLYTAISSIDSESDHAVEICSQQYRIGDGSEGSLSVIFYSAWTEPFAVQYENSVAILSKDQVRELLLNVY